MVLVASTPECFPTAEHNKSAQNLSIEFWQEKILHKLQAEFLANEILCFQASASVSVLLCFCSP